MSSRVTARLALAIGTAWLTISASGCRDGKDDNRDVIRVAARGALTNAAMLVAEEEGDFAREGIRLEYTESPATSAHAIPLLERQELDVVAGSPSAGFYAAVAQGARSRIVADRGHVEPTACDFNAIMGRRGAFTGDSPSAAEVVGKSFSINSPGTAAFIIDSYLASLGLSEPDVKIVKLPQTLEAQAMASGALDVTHASEPYVSQLVAEGHRMLAPATALAPGAHIGSIVFGPSLTVTNRDLGRRFMRAYVRGARRFAQGSTPRNVEILSRRTGFDPKALSTACLPSISLNGSLNLDWLLEFQEWAVKKGHLDAVLGRDAGVDTSFTAAAVAALGGTLTAK